MRTAIAQTLQQSVLLTSLKYFQVQVRYFLGIRQHRSGSTHYSQPLETSVRYIESVFADYLERTGLAASELAGKDILEVGPGDNLGVALCFIAKGARSVACIDAFDPRRDERKNARIYRLLIERLPAEERQRVADAVSFGEDAVRLDPARVACHYGCPVEKAGERLGSARFDLIVSRAVLEHVRDVGDAWDQMVALLRPQGAMCHKIDFRNHGLFERFHPLFFLTVGDALWRLISFPDPSLNRERLPTYRRLAQADFESTRCFITHILEGEDLQPYPEQLIFRRDYGEPERSAVRAIRPRLSARFRGLSDEDLLASGVFLVCRGAKRSAS